MKLKKIIGGLMCLLSVVMIDSRAASMLLVGTEEMPQSMKDKR